MEFQKVCFFLPTSSRGGSELSALECIDALRSQGIQLYVVIPNRGPLIAELQHRQIPYRIIPYKVWIGENISFFNRIATAIWNIILIYFSSFCLARKRCQLIITNTITIYVGAFVAKILRIPHIWYIREFCHEDHGWQFHLGNKVSFWIMDRFSTLCVANSQAVAEKYKKFISPSKVRVIHNPIYIDSSPFTGVLPQKGRFGITCTIVGVIKKTKRQEDAILAMGELRDQGINAQLWIVGSGNQDYVNFLNKLVHDKKLTQQVKFFGQMKNAFHFMKQADVLLLCSQCEAYGRVVVEAMRAGKPVIGTKSGGTVEQIRDGFNGFLYEPGNYRKLARKIKYLHDHPGLAGEMGMNGYRWVTETFTPDYYKEKINSVLEQLEKRKEYPR